MADGASGRLYAKLELLVPALRTTVERVWQGPDVAAAYRRYLVTMHSISRSAVPLLEAALKRATELAANDPVAEGIIPFLSRHIPEESGHDGWVLEDLEAAGGDPREALEQVPSATVAALVGAQYYWIRHYHPVALLGHLAAVEGYPPGLQFAERMVRATGLPREAFRSIARHARIDIQHRRDIRSSIDAQDLSEDQERVLGITGLSTVEGLITVFDELARGGPSAMPLVVQPAGIPDLSHLTMVEHTGAAAAPSLT